MSLVYKARQRLPEAMLPRKIEMIRKMGLPYTYNDLEHTDLDTLRHLHAINAIRLQLTHEQAGIRWISERQLQLGIVLMGRSAILMATLSPLRQRFPAKAHSGLLRTSWNSCAEKNITVSKTSMDG